MLVAAFAVPGCGPKTPVFPRVHGTVTHGGKPVPRGVIVFDPDVTKGNRGPQGYALIQDGRFDTALAGCRGTAGGAMVVRIDGSTPGAAGEDATTAGGALFPSYEVRVDLPATENEQNFDVPIGGKR